MSIIEDEDLFECSVGVLVNFMMYEIEMVFVVDFCYGVLLIGWKFDSYYMLLV